jgi:hypothetical protein
MVTNNMNSRIVLIISLISLFPSSSLAQTSDTRERAAISFSPHTGTFEEGSTFEIPVFLNTMGQSVHTISLHINFDPDKLAIVQPAGNKSIVSLWIEPPSYSNLTGNLILKGAIPDGLTTESGLVSTITFKALALGETRVTIAPDSEVLAGDGPGRPVELAFETGLYTILSRAPDGVRVFSPTHPFEEVWYNSLPVFAWEKPPGTDAFSFVLDNEPLTVPDNTPESSDTSTSFSSVKEGLSYFHLKARKNEVWGGTTHFLVRIDTTPPADFKPKIETLAAFVLASRGIVTFETTDALSGIDHYEAGVINKKNSPDISPVFVEVESPYQLPTAISGELRVIIRAFDKAGNTRVATVDLAVFPSMASFVEENLLVIVLGMLLVLTVLTLSAHYLFGHKILATLREMFKLAKRNAVKEELNPPI